MAKRIALFNYKGGVSKTTTTFHLGWMLAEKGYKVILVDTDPQCNLTGLILGYRENVELEDFYQHEGTRNIRSGLQPAFESRPTLIESVDCFEVENRPGLFLLPGHIRLAEYEVTLGIAQELSGSIQTLQNLPGSISFLLQKTAERYDADFVLIDMSPSLSSINQNLLMTSDYFIVPATPDYFSTMAIDALASILTKWHAWSEKAQGIPVLKETTYPYPNVTPKFLGTVIQNYRLRSGRPSQGFQEWIDEINTTVSEKLVPKLNTLSMTLSSEQYSEIGIDDNYCLASIPDFNSLIATSQAEQTPVFALTNEQIGQRGTVLASSLEKQEEFRRIFDELATRVVELTEDE